MVDDMIPTVTKIEMIRVGTRHTEVGCNTFRVYTTGADSSGNQMRVQPHSLGTLIVPIHERKIRKMEARRDLQGNIPAGERTCSRYLNKHHTAMEGYYTQPEES